MKHKRKSIKINPDGETSELLEIYKKKLGFDSYEKVIYHFLPKSDTEFFENEWNEFKNTISKCISEDSSTHNFLKQIESLYMIGIVTNKSIPWGILEHIKEEYGIEKPISICEEQSV